MYIYKVFICFLYIVVPYVFGCLSNNCFLNCLPPNHFLTVFPPPLLLVFVITRHDEVVSARFGAGFFLHASQSASILPGPSNHLFAQQPPPPLLRNYVLGDS